MLSSRKKICVVLKLNKTYFARSSQFYYVGQYIAFNPVFAFLLLLTWCYRQYRKQKNGFLVPPFLCSRRIQSAWPITNPKPGGPVCENMRLLHNSETDTKDGNYFPCSNQKYLSPCQDCNQFLIPRTKISMEMTPNKMDCSWLCLLKLECPCQPHRRRNPPEGLGQSLPQTGLRKQWAACPSRTLCGNSA